MSPLRNLSKWASQSSRTSLKMRFRFIYESILITGTKESDGGKVAQDETVRNLLFSSIYNSFIIFHDLRHDLAQHPDITRTADNGLTHSNNSCNLRQSKYSRGGRGNLINIFNNTRYR